MKAVITTMRQPTRSMRSLVFLVAAIAACGPSNRATPADAPQNTTPDAMVVLPPDAMIPGFGMPCTTATDCPSGLCVSGTNQNYCTTQCSGNCPEGFACRITEVNGTYESVCLPPIVQVCSACTTDADCGGGVCTTVNGSSGKFCLEVCLEGQCPAGYACTDNPDGMHPNESLCVPSSCDCLESNKGQVRSCMNTDAFGTCYGTQTCDPDNGGWQACNANTATQEVCDGADNNCNMLIDEGTDGVACQNTNGNGTCSGTTLCTGKGGIVCQAKTPMPEICNYADDDCDGMVDEGFPNLGTVCNTGTGACQRYGVEQCSTDHLSVVCSAQAGSPTAEKCNGIDDDCDGSIDEDFPSLGQQCTSGMGQCARIGAEICATGGAGTTCSAVPGSPTTETCNLLDDDCDGQVDEDFKDMGVYDKNNACGGCNIDCTQIYNLPNANGTCNATGSPVCQMNCNAGAYNLNGQIPDGCEFILDPDGIYVSTSDPHSADDASCGLGPYGTQPGYHPCKTIAQGIARATALNRHHVLVANGIYSEGVVVADGRSLLGGYDWETWARDVAATGTLITGFTTANGHDSTIVANNITSPTTVEGFVVYGSVNNKASTTSLAGGNSYAIYVSSSGSSLQIVNNIIFGGRGGPGVNGAIGANGANGNGGTGRNPVLTTADAAYDAFAATGTGECSTSNNRQHANGGAASACPSGSSGAGGQGGGNQCPVDSNCDLWDPNYGCLQNTTNFHWINNTPIAGSPGTGGGGALGGTFGAGAAQGNDMIQIWAQALGGWVCYIPPGTTYGLDGPNGSNGGHGGAVLGCSASAGSVSGNDWVGGTAPAGVTAGNGGGGGGGGAGGGGKCENDGHGHSTCTDGTGKDTIGAHGGGGGAGGCGGAGGGAAGPGGGVFGIFIVKGTASSAPVVTGNQIFRGSGGVGGAGGAGGTGGTGGLGAPGGTSGVPVVFCTDTAGRGGNGGDGGDGSGGGGGCGGSSFGIYTSGYSATPPNYCTGTINTISGGGGGNGGPGGFSIINQGGPGTGGQLTTCSLN